MSQPTALGRPCGATERESRTAMPGDALVRAPRLVRTRGITIEAPPARVWAAMERAGLPGVAGFRVVAADAPRALVLLLGVPSDTTATGPVSGQPAGAMAVPGAGAMAAPVEDGLLATWQWRLHALDEGARTRLVVRQRVGSTRRHHPLRLAEQVDPATERRVMVEIAEWAEAGGSGAPGARASGDAAAAGRASPPPAAMPQVPHQSQRPH